MTNYVKGVDYKLWQVIEEGDCIITKPKPEWRQPEFGMASLNAQALNMMVCALSLKEFDRVCTCASAKEICEKLEVAHERASQVKDRKINLLVTK